MQKLKVLIMLGLITILLFSGCTEKKVNYTIEESNGIPKVINRKQEIMPFELEPEITIGGDDEETFFSRISQVCEDEDGNIYVLDGGESAITVLDEEGNFIRKIGGEGQGPSEFIRPTRIVFNSEGNILVSDTGNMRFQIVDKEGHNVDSHKLDEDVPGYIAYDKNGRLISHNSSFSWGSEAVLFSIYDSEFKRTGSFGEIIENDDSTIQHFKNMGSFCLNSKNQFISVRELDNEYTMYEADKTVRRFNTVMNIEPTEVDVKIVKNGDSMSISIQRDPICFGLSIDSKDRIYSLVRNIDIWDDEIETKTLDYFVLDIFDPTGIHLSRYGLGQNRYSEIYIGKNDKIYLVNNDEAIVVRFPAI